MKKGTTLFLKLAIIFIGIPILILGILMGRWLLNNPVNPEYSYILYPILIGIYITAIPFYTALYMAFRLLIYIDKNKAFSKISVKALRNIKLCASAISGIYMLIFPFVFLLGDKDDAPGIILIGLVPIFISMVFAVFAAVLQKLLQEAIDIKSENDLTIWGEIKWLL